jgi:Big-like domain-containing protein
MSTRFRRPDAITRMRAAVRRPKWTTRRAALAAASASVAILASTYASAPRALALDLLPPVAVPDTLVTTHSRTRVVPPPGVLANDLDLDGGAVAALVSGTLHGTVTLRSNGGYTYTPVAGYVGPDAFTYRASTSNGLGGSLSSLPATVSITVTDRLPDVAPDAYTVVAGTTRFVAAPGVLANDSDADRDDLAAGLVTSVLHGSLSLASSGAFEYTPAADYAATMSSRIGPGMARRGRSRRPFRFPSSLRLLPP